MNYYEEFGLSPSATTEEIRHAHKRLVRLVHPDRLQDDQLRPLAESQMKRLNGIFEILSDLERRREYDRMLAAGVAPPFPVRPRPPGDEGIAKWLPDRPDQKNLTWILAGALCLAVISVGLSGSGDSGHVPPFRPALTAKAGTVYGPPPIQDPEEESTDDRQMVSLTAHRAVQREAGRLRKDLLRAEAQRDEALRDLVEARTRLSVRVPPESAIAVQPVSTLPPLAPVVTATTDAPARAQSALEERAQSLAGTWLYAPRSTGNQKKADYPPEYIELIINELTGELRGRYRARYRVADRAISPMVAFEFQGALNSDGCYNWTGKGGAGGEVTFKLLSDNSLQVAWYASRLGTQMGLGSGAAVLIRRQDF